MRLHRLVLRNYRGIAERDIEFPDSGVVVVGGANEIGKSSMIEALDLLLESKDRSTKKEVKQVKPTYADVGAEVTAEVSTGPYRFVYRKRFHKKCETQLTVMAPRREQLTGDEAHERVRAMLAETTDTDLWRALRVLQAASTTAVDLSGCEALSRALDVAAGATAALSGAEPLIIDRVEDEYARYFTPTGRPTGEWAAAAAQLRAADAEVARCSAAVSEVEQRVQRHDMLASELAALSRQHLVAENRHALAQAAADEVAKLSEQLRESQLLARAAAAAGTASSAAHNERLRLRTDLAGRGALLSTLDAEVRDAADRQLAAQQAAAAADAALHDATAAYADAAQRINSLRRALTRAAEREEADRLAARLSKIDGVQADHDRVCAELSAITVTEAVAQRIEAAAAVVEQVQVQLALLSGTIEITAAADIHLSTSDQQVTLAAGASWSTTATAPTDVAIAGVLTARFSPGVTACDIEAKHAAAQRELASALTVGGVPDLLAARRAEQRRRELQSNRAQLSAALHALDGDDRVDELRSRLSRLRAAQPVAEDVGTDTVAARAELDAAETAGARLFAQCETSRRAAAVAAAQLAETTTRTAVLRDKLATQRAERETVNELLSRHRATISDDELAATADADRRARQTVDQRVTEVVAQLEHAAPDAVATEVADAARAADALRRRHEELSCALHETKVELAVFGTEGRHGQLDAAEIRREHAVTEHLRIGRRARAAELLRSVIARHRDATRLRYVEPFRTELQRLGRPVFGPTFEVDIDSDLKISSRTLNGCTVPYESLSGGVKEQLGILARLAGAALIAKEDTVPVVIDDALGFTDPDRLSKMNAVFDCVGAHGQVIVLTCTPARYDGIAGAHRIDLSA